MIAFLKSDLGRTLLGVLAAAALLLGAYSFGHSAGYDTGHKAGYASRQPEVDHLNQNVMALSKLINDERLATHAKAQEVEHDAAEAAIKTETFLQQQIRARDKIIHDYEKAVPISVQESCGLSVETVRAINKIIDSVNGEQDETKADTGLGVPGSGATTDPDKHNGVRPQPSAQTSG